MFKNKIELLSKLVPLGGIFIILCSSFKLVVFYDQFNISIADYLTIGEYATLFIDDIIYYVQILIVFLILDEVFSLIKSPKNSPRTSTFNYDRFKRLRIFIALTFIVFTTALIVLVFSTNNLLLRLSFLKSLSIFPLSSIYAYLLFSDTKLKPNYKTFMAFIVLIWILFDPYIDAERIIENENKLIYKINLKNKTVITDENLQYLGKSEKYIYLFNLKNKQATILPTSDVNQIEITEH